MEPTDWQRMRDEMVDRQIIGRGIHDVRVIEAMRKVPRERFVMPGSEAHAYDDSALSIESGQTISQPYMVALMAQSLALGPEDRVLDVGTGSGYAAAVMAEIVGEVFSIERSADLARRAAERLHDLGYANVTVEIGDGTLGWEEHAPFDTISVAASSPRIPKPLERQLRVGGRMVIPIGSRSRWQDLVLVERRSVTDYGYRSLGAVRFVQLIGEQGW